MKQPSMKNFCGCFTAPGGGFLENSPLASGSKENAGQGWGGHPRPAGGERYKKYTYYIHQKYQIVKLKINYSKFLFFAFPGSHMKPIEKFRFL
jgi:hypothetical protein